MQVTIHFLPAGKSIRVRRGTTLFQAAGMARVAIRTRCGQRAACLMCKVKVDEQSGLSPMSDQERHKLGTLREQGIRLSCQARAIGNVEVIVPEDPLSATVRKLLSRQEEE